MKKVLLLANSSKGVYGFRNELVVKMLEQYEVFVSVPDTVCTEELAQEGCKIIKTDINRRGMNPIEDFKLLLSYWRLLSTIRPDLVLTYTIKPNIYGGIVCRLRRIPYITTITGLGSAMEGDGLLQKLTGTLYRIAMKKAACIFFQNETNQRIFEERNIKGQAVQRVSGSGVDLEHFSYMALPDEEKIRFLFVSRILKEKGIEEYLDTAGQIKKEYPDTEFWILGKCEEEYEPVLQKLQQDGVVQYFGMQKDVRQYLKDVHCLIHPSFYPEGMSNVCLEAAACGRAVITTDHTGCRETVSHGKTGYIVEKRNVSQLVNAVKDFIRLSYEDKTKMGQNGRAKVENEFDRKMVTNSYMNMIQSILIDR